MFFPSLAAQSQHSRCVRSQPLPALSLRRFSVRGSGLDSDFPMSNIQEALPVQNQSEVAKAIERRQPLGEQIAALIGDKSSLVIFDDLRKAAIALGISAKRGTDGKVRSVDPVARATFSLLLSRVAKHHPMKTSQLMELVNLSKTQNADGSKGIDGAFRFIDGKVKGDAASLGSLKLASAFAAGNVSLD